MSTFAVALLLLLLGSSSGLRSANNENHPPPVAHQRESMYRAAVIEHVAESAYDGWVPNTTVAIDLMLDNLYMMESKIETAANSGTDIVVLGEMALTALIDSWETMGLFLMPLPPTGSNLAQNMDHMDCAAGTFPCPPQDVVLRRLVNISVTLQIYLVVNWGDCLPPNAANGTAARELASCGLQYNTEFVLSPTGVLVAKYYKMHTFKAVEFDTPTKSDPTSFPMTPPKTGGAPIRIGIGVCFDSMYADPILPLMRQNVSDFVISHWWTDQYAKMSAVTWFQALSSSLNINIVVAGSVWPAIIPWGSGSGIFNRGLVVQSSYRTNHDNVFLWNDVLLVGWVSTSGAGSSMKNAVPPTQPMKITTKPKSLCVNYRTITQEELQAGKALNVDLQCLNLTCSLKGSIINNAKGSAGSQVDDNTRWVLLIDYGYYGTPDGTGTYYYEEVCSFYRCNSAITNTSSWRDLTCLSTLTSLHDDHGPGLHFSDFQLTANFSRGGVPFVMFTNDEGNVAIEATSNAVVEGSDGVIYSNTTTMRTKNPTSSLIGATLMSRVYEGDAKIELKKPT